MLFPAGKKKKKKKKKKKNRTMFKRNSGWNTENMWKKPKAHTDLAEMPPSIIFAQSSQALLS